jgi:GT2 family glycosyltransferase
MTPGGQKEPMQTNTALPAPSCTTADIPGLSDADWLAMLDQRPVRPELLDAAACHEPFLRWLVGAMRPRCLVELGTTTGSSYFALCQAVVDAGLVAEARAVSATGRPSDDPALSPDRINALSYSAFSTLVEAPLDEAADFFRDGTIDLLQLRDLGDAGHAAALWERFRPKLSGHAVVLVHGIAAGPRWPAMMPVWEALLQAGHPHIEFRHGEGLGVVALGTKIAEPIAAMCALEAAGSAMALRERFARLGERSELACLLSQAQRSAAIAREHHVAALTEALEHTERGKAGVTEAKAGAAEALAREELASARTAEANARAAAAEASLADALAREELAALDIQALRGTTAAPTKALAAAMERLKSLEARLRETEEALARNTSRADAIESSTLWRATGPVRTMMHRLPAVRRLVRRSLRFGYRLWRPLPAQRPSPALYVAASSPIAADPPPEKMVRHALADASPEALRLEAGSLRLRDPGERPDVTIIVPTYGQVPFTLMCLRSIADAPPAASVEVIVVEDAAPDPLARIPAAVAGIRFVQNASNLGFLRSCNTAAKLARGRYLILQNNDTQFQPGAIDALVDLADARPDAGLIGAKLVYPDGRLQEAGGIVWNDASAMNWGRLGDPAAPEHCYLRETDYCTGASILVRRDVFETLGGFDERYAPAYYEDTDLAFRVRDLGLKVLFEPRAVVIHHEGITHGTDVTSGVKAHQLVNQRVMFERWEPVLRRDHQAPWTRYLRARDRAAHRHVILVADVMVPEPDHDAGSRNTLSILKALLGAGCVVKFWPWHRPHQPVAAERLERLGIEVIDSRSPHDLAAWLQENGDQIDSVMLMRPHLAAALLPVVRQGTRASLLYYGHDLHYVRMRMEAKVRANAALAQEADEMERFEQALWGSFDVVLYPSEAEAALVRRTVPEVDARSVVPYCFDEFSPRETVTPGSTLLFVGGFLHQPNVDAALWLVQEILPLIRRECPEAHLIIAGSNPPEDVRALACGHVTVTGRISDEELLRLYRTSRGAVVPLRFGAGVKGKVAEALHLGLPLVTTPIGAEGIPGIDEIVPVSTEAPGIAEAVVRLMRDDRAWLQQSRAQVEFAALQFSRNAVQRSLVSALAAAQGA